jgi:hypothetical protein
MQLFIVIILALLSLLYLIMRIRKHKPYDMIQGIANQKKACGDCALPRLIQKQD